VIETCTAQNGSLVIRVDGRLLASAVDPLAEAREWVQRRRILLAKVKSVFVLGAGSGYHVAELFIQTDANIVVIERSPELIAAVQRIQGFDAKRVQFVSVEKSAALRGQEHVRAAVAESFLVLQHGPSMAFDPEFYRDCKNQLLGREWGSLNWQWQLKGFASLDAQPKIHADESQLTIYDLEQTELVQNSSERERMLVKALRELVK
jgi:hypothetical protein